jgi:hypothetical protein
MLDKSIKKYITKKLDDYFKKQGFIQDIQKDLGFLSKRTEFGYIWQYHSVSLMYGKRFECGYLFGVCFYEAGLIINRVLHKPVKNSDDNLYSIIGNSYLYDVAKYFDYNDLITDFRESESSNPDARDSFQLHTIEDAEIYFNCFCKLNEQVVAPFFDSIKTINDVDDFYNKKIIEGNEQYIKKISDINEHDKWCLALIAARLAKNPHYDELENTYKSWMQYPWMQQRLEELIAYFKEHNL